MQERDGWMSTVAYPSWLVGGRDGGQEEEESAKGVGQCLEWNRRCGGDSKPASAKATRLGPVCVRRQV